MSGVSITEGGNIDMDALVAGGDAFLSRVKELREHKAKHEKALADLNMGKNAAAMMASANASIAAAEKATAEAKAAAEDIIQKAKQEAEAAITEARTSATKMVEAAQIKVTQLEDEVAKGRVLYNQWAKEAEAKADSILNDAKAKLIEAEKQHADNVTTAKQLLSDQTLAQKAAKEAATLKTALEAKIASIKAAVAS